MAKVVQEKAGGLAASSAEIEDSAIGSKEWPNPLIVVVELPSTCLGVRGAISETREGRPDAVPEVRGGGSSCELGPSNC